MSLDGWTKRILSSIAHDFRFGCRALVRTPLATTVMVGSVAIGVGVTTAVFSLADAMLFRPLPYPKADRLVVPYQTVNITSQARTDTLGWTFGEFEVLRRAIRVFDGVGFATWTDALGRWAQEDVPMRIEAITPSLLGTFFVRPQRGLRLTEADDGLDASTTVALISDAFWAKAFARSESAIGSIIYINHQPVRIAGVMPPGFKGFAIGADLWLPVHMLSRIEPSTSWTERLSNERGTVIARMAQGMTIAGLRRHLDAAFPIVNDVAGARFVAPASDRGVGVVTLAEARQHPLVKPLLKLMAASVTMLLLIVCANIASILLARGYARRVEVGVRIAIGASRRRIIAAALAECVVLSGLGLPLGVLVASQCAQAMARFRPPVTESSVLLRGTDLLANASLAPNGRVLAFATIVAALSALLFGIGPAIARSRVDSARLISGGGDLNSTPPVKGRQALVVVEVALATMLLIAAGLMARSLSALLDTDLGFDSAGVFAIDVASIDTSASARVQRSTFLSTLEHVPGVSAAAASDCVPFDLSCVRSMEIRAADNPDGTSRPLEIDVHNVSPGYFRVLSMPIVAGRSLSIDDTIVSPRRVVISEGAAKRLFGDASTAIGRNVLDAGSTNEPMTVAGVVRDVHFRAVEGRPKPTLFRVASETRRNGFFRATLFVRSRSGIDIAMATTTSLRANRVPMSIATTRRLEDVVRRATATTRFVGFLLVGFGGAAMTLAAMGVYGVMSYMVAQRRRELGIRLVLGASPSLLSRRVIGRGIALVAVGIGIGVLLAVALARVVAAFLYGVSAFDPMTLAVSAAVVCVVGIAASALPAVTVSRMERTGLLALLRSN